jgi:hypothetical protein
MASMARRTVLGRVKDGYSAGIGVSGPSPASG